uniref:Uncharacterized protein n=1 Tax=mine drainage metagenome TaxID=410659 RepID=E6QWG3_9ZZZZ
MEIPLCSLGQAAWEPVGLKGNRLQIRLTGAYFTAFLVNRTTIDRQNRQNLPSPSRILRATAARFAYSTVIRPLIPRTFGHPVHADSATQSTRIRPPYWSGSNAR